VVLNTLLQLLKTEVACYVYWMHAILLPFFLFSDDFFVVQVPGVEYDGVASALESLLLLDHHDGSLMFL